MIIVLGLSGFPVGHAGHACLAATALGAGEAVEHVLPGEVLDGLDAERRVLALEVHRRQLAPRRELAESDVGERGDDVEVLRERQVARGSRRRAACAPTRAMRERGLETSRPSPAPASGPPIAFDTNAPGSIAVGRDLEDLGQELRGDHAADERRIIERVAGEREPRAAATRAAARTPTPTTTSTMTATTFWSALTAAQTGRRTARDRTAWMSPPVTMFAVPDREQDEAPEDRRRGGSPAGRSRNIRVWTNAYRTRPDEAARDVGETVGPASRAAANTRRWRAIASSEERDRAPEQRRTRAGRAGPRANGSNIRLTACRSAGRRGRPARAAAWSNGPARVSSAWSSSGDHRLERLERALRATRQVDDQAPAADADDARATARRTASTGGPSARIASAMPGDLVVEHGAASPAASRRAASGPCRRS